MVLKVVLFLIPRVWQPNWDAVPNFKPNSKSILHGLSNEVTFVSEFHLGAVKFLKTESLNLPYGVIQGLS